LKMKESGGVGDR